MFWKTLVNTSRWIAPLICLALTASCFESVAQQLATVRIGSPALGWIASADGSQLISIAGVPDSPRAGIAIPAVGSVTEAYPAPDGRTAIVTTSDSVLLYSEHAGFRALTSLEPDERVSAAWDRDSATFAICFRAACESRDLSGSLLQTWKVPDLGSLLAYSRSGGVLLASEPGAVWLDKDRSVVLPANITCAAFSPEDHSLWVLEPQGTLRQYASGGAMIREIDLLEGAIGFVLSANGTRVFAARADGRAVEYDLRSADRHGFDTGSPIEGVWLAPGSFTARLHRSAKAPIAFWNGESGQVAWMPGLEDSNEVRQ